MNHAGNEPRIVNRRQLGGLISFTSELDDAPCQENLPILIQFIARDEPVTRLECCEFFAIDLGAAEPPVLFLTCQRPLFGDSLPQRRLVIAADPARRASRGMI